MRTCLALFAIACGLAVCSAQQSLTSATLTTSASGVSSPATATVSFTSALGQSASTSNSVALPCFTVACTCSGANVISQNVPQVTWSSPTTTCPTSAATTTSGTMGTPNFAVINTANPAILSASPAFTVTASTSSGVLAVDSMGNGAAPTTLGGTAVSASVGQTGLQAADKVSGAATGTAMTFAFTTTSPVPIGGQVVINLPYQYLPTQATLVSTSSGTTYTCAVTNTKTAAQCSTPASSSGKITCTTGGAILAAGATTIVFAPSTTANGWRTGSPSATPTPLTYTVTTQTSGGLTIDAAGATGTLTAFTSGTIATGPAMTAGTAADFDAQLTAPGSTLTTTFTTVSGVPVGGKVVFTVPKGFLRVFTSWTSTNVHTCVNNDANAPQATATTDVWTCTIVTAALTGGAQSGTSATTVWGLGSNLPASAFTASTWNVQTMTADYFVIDANAATSTAPGQLVAAGTMTATAIAAASFSQATDMNPGLTASTGTLSLGFTTSIVLKQGSQTNLVFTLPYKFLKASTAAYTITGGAGAGACTTTDTDPVAACTGATPGASAGFTTMTCTITTDIAITASALLLSIGSGSNVWRIASNNAAATFTVQAMTLSGGVVTSKSSTAATPAVGGTLGAAAASVASVTTDNVPGVTTTGTLTLGFTPASALSTGSTIVFTLPNGYMTGALGSSTISGGASVTCSLTQGAAATACAAAGKSTISCVTGTAVIPTTAVATVTLAIGQWSLSAGASGTYTVATFNSLQNPIDLSSSGGALVSANAQGTVSAVQAAVFSASTDQVPGLATTTGTLKFAFTTQTAFLANSNANIVFKFTSASAYLATAGAFTSKIGATDGPTGTCSPGSFVAQTCASTTCAGTVAAAAGYQLLTCTFTAALTAGAVTLTLTAGTYTVGSSQAAGMYTVYTTTTAGVIDKAASTMAALPALAAGAVSAVTTAAFSVAADMVPGAVVTGTLTFGFNTATKLVSGGKIMVSLPVGYLTGSITAKLGPTASAVTINCALSSVGANTCPVRAAYQLMTCTTTADVLPGAQSLVLSTFMVGPKNAGNTYMVWTTAVTSGVIVDTMASGSVPAITTGGTASGTGAATFSAATDKVPGLASTTGTFTLPFSISTSLPVTTGKIIFSLTQGYILTATAATLTGTSPVPTSTCSLSRGPGAAATCSSAAVMDTLTCTLGTANLAPGSYSLVLTLNTWTLGGAQPQGAFSVMTTNSGVTLDASSTTGMGTLPSIGGTVAVTSATATTAADAAKVGTAASGSFKIAFTTTTTVLNGGKITFTFPANYFSSIVTAGPLLTGQDTTAPTVALTNNAIVMTVGANLPAGASTLEIAAGWKSGASLSTASFPAIANFNKGSYTLSNLVTPPIYSAAQSGGLTYQVKFGSSECSAALALPQIGTAPVTPGTTPGGPGASSSPALLMSVLLAVSSAVLMLL